MLTSAFEMLVSSVFLMLRLGKNSGSFPKPLNAAMSKNTLSFGPKATLRREMYSLSTICGWWRT